MRIKKSIQNITLPLDTISALVLLLGYKCSGQCVVLKLMEKQLSNLLIKNHNKAWGLKELARLIKE